MTPPDWQSLLFVPAGVEKHLASAIRLRPDAIILDLEDAIAPAAKKVARAAVRHAQTQIKSAGIGCVVRVNAGLRAMLADMDAMDLAATDAIIVPKCDSVRGLENVAEITGGTIALIALIESPAALAHLTDIAAMPACAGLMIGSEDYAANLGVDPNGGALVHVATLLGIAACQRGLLTIGFAGSIANFRDLDLYARQIAQGRALGMRAVAAIHPAQLPVIAGAYAVTEAERAWADSILSKAQTIETQGVVALDGEMIDAPVIARARRILARCEVETAGRSRAKSS